MATPARRSTRASSRQSTPSDAQSGLEGTGSPTSHRTSTRKGVARAAIPVKTSTSYGSAGLPAVRSKARGLPTIQDAAEAIAQGVQEAETHLEVVETTGGRLQTVPEEGSEDDKGEDGGKGKGDNRGKGARKAEGGDNGRPGRQPGGPPRDEPTQSRRNAGFGGNAGEGLSGGVFGGKERQTPRPSEGQSVSFGAEGGHAIQTPAAPRERLNREREGDSPPRNTGARVVHRGRASRSWLPSVWSFIQLLWTWLLALSLLLALLFMASGVIFFAYRAVDGYTHRPRGPALRNLTSEQLAISAEFAAEFNHLERRVDLHENRIVASFEHLSARINKLSNDIKQLPTAQPEGHKFHRVNYFSTGLGAVVDPYLTSPTKMIRRSLKTRLISSWNSITLRQSLPPTEALGPWDDIGDCWCAPPSGGNSDGKSQLSVLLPREMIPTDLVVEHIHRDATLDIASAPKELELWVQILDEDIREAAGNAAFSRLPNDYEEKLWAAQKQDPFNKALDRTWLRIGKWRYDINSRHNVQSFHVAVRLEDFHASIRKVVVRVNSNWGNRDYVCLYRLKLYGIPAQENRDLFASGVTEETAWE
ncbi:hypothetical protein MMC24_000124 [Lignoscripta atroalba]|nr:hypothetical protein [Lignoscripta atroalba]